MKYVDDTDIIVTPFTIAVDTREQFPWTFQNFRADANQQHRPLVVKQQRATLPTGDYSIIGLEDRVCIERKSKSDAYHTFGADRERFERELERMTEMDYAAIVIECSWQSLLNSPLESNLQPKTIYRSLVAWSVRYGVHVWCCFSRSFAERTCFRILQRFWKEHSNGR